MDSPRHPITKIIASYQKSLVKFILQQLEKINQYVENFDAQIKAEIKSESAEKLLNIILEQNRTFIQMVIRAIILFQMLDTKSGDKSESILYSLVLSHILNVPKESKSSNAYEQLRRVIRYMEQEKMMKAKYTIRALRKNGDKKFAELIGISDVKIGRYLLEALYHKEPEVTTQVKKTTEKGEDQSNEEKKPESKEERFDDKACLATFKAYLKMFHEVYKNPIPVINI